MASDRTEDEIILERYPLTYPCLILKEIWCEGKPRWCVSYLS